MVLSVVDAVVRTVYAADWIIKVMDKLQDFVCIIYKGVWNTGQLTSVPRNNEHGTAFDKCEDFL
jgi:hypothetical protein